MLQSFLPLLLYLPVSQKSRTGNSLLHRLQILLPVFPPVSYTHLPDEGLTVLSKGKVLGYLAQHQELDTDATIYEEVRKVRAYLLEWEQKIRAMEAEMKHLSGPALQELMESYTRLTHTFEPVSYTHLPYGSAPESLSASGLRSCFW